MQGGRHTWKVISCFASPTIFWTHMPQPGSTPLPTIHSASLLLGFCLGTTPEPTPNKLKYIFMFIISFISAPLNWANKLYIGQLININFSALPLRWFLRRSLPPTQQGLPLDPCLYLPYFIIHVSKTFMSNAVPSLKGWRTSAMC